MYSDYPLLNLKPTTTDFIIADADIFGIMVQKNVLLDHIWQLEL